MASKLSTLVRNRKLLLVIASVLAAVIGAHVGHSGGGIKPLGLWDGPG